MLSPDSMPVLVSSARSLPEVLELSVVELLPKFDPSLPKDDPEESALLLSLVELLLSELPEESALSPLLVASLDEPPESASPD